MRGRGGGGGERERERERGGAPDGFGRGFSGPWYEDDCPYVQLHRCTAHFLPFDGLRRPGVRRLCCTTLLSPRLGLLRREW
jgi:hypothetical protein